MNNAAIDKITEVLKASGIPMPANIEVLDDVATLEYHGDQKALANPIMAILQNHISDTIKTRTYPMGPGGVKTVMMFIYVEDGEGHGLDHALDTDTLHEIQMRLRATVSEAVIAYTQIDGTSLEVGETLGNNEVDAFGVFIVERVADTFGVDDIESKITGVASPTFHDDNQSFSITVYMDDQQVTELFKFELGTRIGEPT